MHYKTLIYHPYNERNLCFTQQNFTHLLEPFSSLSLMYVSNEQAFYQALQDTHIIMALKVKADIYDYAKNLQAIFTCMAGRDAIPTPPEN